VAKTHKGIPKAKVHHKDLPRYKVVMQYEKEAKDAYGDLYIKAAEEIVKKVKKMEGDDI
jgi:hypothetical protein